MPAHVGELKLELEIGYGAQPAHDDIEIVLTSEIDRQLGITHHFHIRQIRKHGATELDASLGAYPWDDALRRWVSLTTHLDAAAVAVDAGAHAPEQVVQHEAAEPGLARLVEAVERVHHGGPGASDSEKDRDAGGERRVPDEHPYARGAVDADEGDEDSPTVTNLDRVLFTGGYDWLITVFGPSVVIFVQPADEPLTTARIAGADAALVPLAWVVDAVNAVMDADSLDYRRLPPTLDAGAGWVSGTYTGESLRRRADAEGKLQDTDDSGADLVVEVAPQPGR